jgi:rfaE bifunctional protein nucleotidyltransferase chain/domain
MRNPQTKIFSTLNELVTWREELHRLGKRLVVTNGCYDIMHRGHAESLYKGRLFGDALLVLINGDESITSLKGPTRPIISQEHRLYMLASLECVDAVFSFNDKRATTLFEALAPDVYVKGADYTEETLNREEYAVLKRGGASFEFIEFVEGCSTSLIVQKIISDTNSQSPQCSSERVC